MIEQVRTEDGPLENPDNESHETTRHTHTYLPKVGTITVQTGQLFQAILLVVEADRIRS